MRNARSEYLIIWDMYIDITVEKSTKNSRRFIFIIFGIEKKIYNKK